jgi:hypothetical protein
MKDKCDTKLEEFITFVAFLYHVKCDSLLIHRVNSHAFCFHLFPPHNNS